MQYGHELSTGRSEQFSPGGSAIIAADDPEHRRTRFASSTSSSAGEVAIVLGSVAARHVGAC
jgi:hypothetical protein